MKWYNDNMKLNEVDPKEFELSTKSTIKAKDIHVEDFEFAYDFHDTFDKFVEEYAHMVAQIVDKLVVETFVKHGFNTGEKFLELYRSRSVELGLILKELNTELYKLGINYRFFIPDEEFVKKDHKDVVEKFNDIMEKLYEKENSIWNN